MFRLMTYDDVIRYFQYPIIAAWVLLVPWSSFADRFAGLFPTNPPRHIEHRHLALVLLSISSVGYGIWLA
jgi:hypothetical protein